MIRRTTLEIKTSVIIPSGERVHSMMCMPSVFRPHKVMLPAGWMLTRVVAGTADVTFTACPSEHPGLVNAYFVACDAALRPGEWFAVEAQNVISEPQEWLGFKVRGAEAVPWECEGSGAV